MDLLAYCNQFFDFGQLKSFRKIFVLVSGGIDSTLLYHVIYSLYPDQTVPVNCYNPYENSPTLDTLRHAPRFIEVKNTGGIDYLDVLKQSFMKLEDAMQLRKEKRYHKKIFPCCKYIKHKAFFHSKLFTQPNTVVVSGIKTGDGSQRNAFLSMLRNGKEKISQSKTINNYEYLRHGKAAPTFFHLHKGGQLYCYPFRDYQKREFPDEVIAELRKTYPKLRHSGCAICPILLLFNLERQEPERYKNSKRFYKSLASTSIHLE